MADEPLGPLIRASTFMHDQKETVYGRNLVVVIEVNSKN